MNLTRLFFVPTAVSMVACSAQPSQIEQTEQLALRKQAMTSAAMKFDDEPPEMACTATKVSEETVQTQYDIYVYEQAWKRTATQIRDSSADILSTFEKSCGGDIVRLNNDLKGSDGDVVPKAFVLAMLKAGR